MTDEVFRVDERQRPRRFVTKIDAARMFRDAQGRPDSHLEGDETDFTFWLHAVPGVKAVRVHVFAVEVDEVPVRHD